MIKRICLLFSLIFFLSCAYPQKREIAQAQPAQDIIIDNEHYDVIIAGSGLAGLSGAVYLTAAGKKVLLLERDSHLGGLAAWNVRRDGVRYDRGAAYWTDAYEEELKILKYIGLGNFAKKFPIPDPIDSYYVDGEFYSDIWSPKTVARLPASFALFKFELERANDDHKIPNQPFEEFASYGGDMVLDSLTTRVWIEGMPLSLEKSLKKIDESLRTSQSHKERKNLQKLAEEGRRIQTRFQFELKNGRLKGSTGMEAPLELLDLYCRSALGTVSDHVSAMAFANFYISEITTRYTTPQGTGVAADHMLKMLSLRPKLFQALMNTPITKIRSLPDHVEALYVADGKTHMVSAGYAIYAIQLNQAPQLIEGFRAEAPDQADLMSTLGYSHYSVHAVTVQGHPYRAAYDTWVHTADSTNNDFTDVILGLWVNKNMLGYKGYRDFKKDPPVADSTMTIYNPLSPSGPMRSDSQPEGGAPPEGETLPERAVRRMGQLFSKLPPTLWRGPFVVKKIETSFWPFSVHIVEPGHYIKKAKILRRPFGRIFFAHSSLGAPAFEEALFRGHCAADNVLSRMNQKLTREEWSRCPVDGPYSAAE